MPDSLTAALKHEARRLGFDLVGVASATDAPTWQRYREWVDAGRAGAMGYLADRVAQRRHPRSILTEVRSVLMLAINYHTVEPAPAEPGSGLVSRYAWGGDYHRFIRERLRRLTAFLRHRMPDARARGVVDTAPLLERDYARLAGLGWIGKNTCLINRGLGSWLFLAGLLTSVELDADQPFDGEHCGSCRRCLDACPTGALVEPYVLDARRCLSYATIELRGPIPDHLHGPMGDRLFGCDTCQAVCPHNRRTPCSTEPDFRPRPGMNPLRLAEVESLEPDGFSGRFGDTPMERAGLDGLRRNALIVRGNQSGG
jgi:epoxyqueuosine reductase